MGKEMNGIDQITVEDLLEWAKDKEKDYHFSRHYCDNVHDSKAKSGYKDGGHEKVHMLHWCKLQCEINPGRPADNFYSQLGNVALTLWIAEAAGVDKGIVEKAYEAAKDEWNAKNNVNSATKAARGVIPWSEILSAPQSPALLKKP